LHQAGYTLRLEPTLQVKHLKRWTLFSMLRSDILDRAIPWTQLLQERRTLRNDLNLQTKDRLSAVVVGLGWLGLGGLWITPYSGLVLLLALLLLLALNRGVYAFLYRQRGVWFLVRAVPLHALYYTYSTLIFILITFRFILKRWRV
jgi:hypothetical protein